MELSQVGKFKIVDKLGAGAMGEVFRAHDPVLGRDVAIKVVAGKLSDDERARERFQREAQSAAQLNHPNIITVYDFGEEQGMAYMAMELLEGNDLRELLAQGKVASLEDKLALMEQILDGLAFAHAKGVVHRDLKPGNVHVLPNGQVKIMDFGLARRAQDGAATGVIMGTPYYMAPEQAQGERATARSDIFSLGAMFYEMLAGRRPFTGPSIPAVLFAVVHKDPSRSPRRRPTSARARRLRDAGAREEARRALRRRRGDAPGAARGLGGRRRRGELRPTRPPTRPRPERLGPALSALPGTPPELRSALEEIDQYLADRVPPLMVADSVALFADAPVEGAAAEIVGWAERQQAVQADLPLVDLLFHALHKLSVIGEFHLVENQKLLAFLRAVGAAIAEALPARRRPRPLPARARSPRRVGDGPHRPRRDDAAKGGASGTGAGPRRRDPRPAPPVDPRAAPAARRASARARPRRRRAAASPRRRSPPPPPRRRARRSWRTTCAACAPWASSPAPSRSSATSARSSRTGPCRRRSCPTPPTSGPRARSRR